ncbi:hypothetical protein AABB24_035797 [Solanum stoloniferum]|uniref:Uncharacterized protein n=1 Tax=Solanum stoloniferum TaxID=62892 RepID=A0ABD2R931_9SOLN
MFGITYPTIYIIVMRLVISYTWWINYPKIANHMITNLGITCSQPNDPLGFRISKDFIFFQCFIYSSGSVNFGMCLLLDYSPKQNNLQFSFFNFQEYLGMSSFNVISVGDNKSVRFNWYVTVRSQGYTRLPCLQLCHLDSQ